MITQKGDEQWNCSNYEHKAMATQVEVSVRMFMRLCNVCT